jgi:5-methylcytosine-specific restriction endonuclease McrA
MSPIRAADKRRYPRNWSQISKAVRKERAGDRCECAGECGTGHEGRCEARNGQPHPVTGSTVVLTVAHRDRTPENCAYDNLFAACQRCHLAYDAEQHRASAAWTRAGRPDIQLELFPGTGPGRAA